jgi:uncharacterized damage-inducible protein DinB
MPEDRNELLQHYRRSRDDLLAAIDGLSDETLSDPSLDGWSVKDHMLHLAFWDDLRTSEVNRISAGYESALRTNDQQERSINELAHALRAGLSPAQAKWELTGSRQRLEAAISVATARGLDPSLYGEAGLRTSHEAEHTEWIRRWRNERGQ